MLLKSIFFALLSAALSTAAITFCRAQTNKLSDTGNAGIGTSAPTVLLEIKKAAQTGVERLMKLSVSDAPGDFLTIDNATNGGNQFIPLIRGTKISDNRYALMISGCIGDGTVDNGTNAAVAFDARLTTGKINNRPLFVWQSYSTPYMTMLSDGSLGIGTETPQAKLAVNGDILAKEVKVKNDISVPDYVFEEDYDLPALDDVEAYVKVHKHLPEIPSATEIEQDGLNLAEMNLLLLRKVEELTLYLIEQRNDKELLQNQIDELNHKVTYLESSTKTKTK